MARRILDVWKRNDRVVNRGRATDGRTVEMIVNVMSWERIDHEQKESNCMRSKLLLCESTKVVLWMDEQGIEM